MKNRKALCIGINAYVKELNNAINDATSMHEILTYKGYESTLEIDLDYVALEQSIENFCKSINDETDSIVFFFAGHGVEKDKINYLLSSDINDDNPLEYEGYLLQRIFDQFNEVCHEEVPKIIILDACRSDKGKELLNQLSRSNNINEINLGQTQPSNQKKNYLIAFSTSPGNSAYDGKDKQDTTNGIYTKALVESFKSYNIPIEDMLRDIRDTVLKASNYKQLPWEHSSLNQKFYLNFRPHHKKLIDIHELPFSIVNDAIFISDTKYIAIGNSQILYLKDITNPVGSIHLPVKAPNAKNTIDAENDEKDTINSNNEFDLDMSIIDYLDIDKNASSDDYTYNDVSNIELISIAKSENYIVVSTSASEIFVYEKESFRYAKILEEDEEEELRSVVISDDELYCAFCYCNKFVIIDLTSKTIVYNSEVEYLNEIYSISFLPNCSSSIILCGTYGKLELIENINTKKETRKKIETKGITYKIKFTPNGKKMITTHYDGEITIWNANTFEPIETISLDKDITNQVRVLNSNKDGVEVSSNHIVSLSIVNNSLITVGTSNVSYCLIDIKFNKIIKEYSLDSTEVTPYALTCNEEYLVCSGYKRTIFLYSVYDKVPYMNEKKFIETNNKYQEDEIPHSILFET